MVDYDNKVKMSMGGARDELVEISPQTTDVAGLLDNAEGAR